MLHRKEDSIKIMLVERLKETILWFYISHCIPQNCALPQILGTVMMYVQDGAN